MRAAKVQRTKGKGKSDLDNEELSDFDMQEGDGYEGDGNLHAEKQAEEKAG